MKENHEHRLPSLELVLKLKTAYTFIEGSPVSIEYVLGLSEHINPLNQFYKEYKIDEDVLNTLKKYTNEHIKSDSGLVGATSLSLLKNLYLELFDNLHEYIDEVLSEINTYNVFNSNFRTIFKENPSINNYLIDKFTSTEYLEWKIFKKIDNTLKEYIKENVAIHISNHIKGPV